MYNTSMARRTLQEIRNLVVFHCCCIGHFIMYRYYAMDCLIYRPVFVELGTILNTFMLVFS